MSYDPTSPHFERALDSVREELSRIPAEKVEPVIRADVRSATMIALGSVPKVAHLRTEIARRFGTAAVYQLDRLETVACAAAKAHCDHEVFVKGQDLVALGAEVAEVRRTLLTDAQSLVHRKLLDPNRLAQLSGDAGYKNVAFDVLTLVSAFKSTWSSIEQKTPVRLEDLDRADGLAHQLASEAAIREQAVTGSSPTGEMRRRAWTLFARTYEELRRMVSYLRWREDDADDFLPSLYSGRKNGKKDEPEPPVAPPGAANIPPGMPGASPFAT